MTPELCEGCTDRDCVRACKQNAIRVGRGYVYVDWERCDACLACVEMCETGALRARDGTGSRRPPTPAGPSGAAAAGMPTFPESAGAGQRRGLTGAGGPGLRDLDAPPQRPWTRTDGLIVLLCMLATLAALNLALSTHLVMLMPASGRVYARAGGLAFAYALEIGVIWVLGRRHHASFLEGLGLRPVVRSAGRAAISAVLVLLALMGARLISTAYSIVTEALNWQPTFGWDTDLTRVFGHGWVGLALTVLLVVIVGPFVEEITFRGVVQSAFRRRWSSWASILATSALFAIYHFDPWMFVPTFVLALGLGWLAENRRGLWPSITLHVLYNGVTVAAVFWLAAHGG